MSDFHQRQITMLDNAIQVRREQAARMWKELSDQMELGGDSRTVHLQHKLIALNIAVLDLGGLTDRREVLIAENGPAKIRAPKKIETKVRQLDPAAWRR